MQILLVFVGGGLGAALRHFVNILSMRLIGNALPLGTLFINVTGSVLMGFVAALFALKLSLPPTLRLFIATGILGGYTTFSTFSLETALLVERGHWLYAVGYVVVRFTRRRGTLRRHGARKNGGVSLIPGAMAPTPMR